MQANPSSEEKKTNEQSTSSSHAHDHDQLQLKVEKITKKLHETEEIAKRAQSDYLRLKLDFDSYVERAQAAQAASKIELLGEIAKKILPTVTQLHHMVKSMPTELAEHSRAQGVKLSYEKAITELAHIGIYPINANRGDELDLLAHLPISTQPTDDAALKNKIIEQIEPGYMYRKNDQEQILLPAKVIVGQ